MANFPIPPGAFAQHTIALGKTRSGKSSKLRLIVERLLDDVRQRPVCIVDPKGDWWGLKSSADGRSAGYPVIIFGGEHSDLPINEHSGAAVAELITTEIPFSIIDLGGWMVGARTRFFIDFASTLFRLSRGARHLVIDECHNFAPQGRVIDPDSAKMVHWSNRIASEGAGKGITLISASQRPQKVHKDYVTSHETLIACRVIHPLDRNAIKEWVDGCADPSVGKEVVGALAGLDRKEAYVWSPEIGFGPSRVAFPMFRTYDSFKPQEAGSTGSLKGWAAVDLGAAQTRLAAIVEEAKANDPKALKATIIDLQKQLAAKIIQPNGAMIADHERIGYEAGHKVGYAEGHRHGFLWGASKQRGAVAEAIKFDLDYVAPSDMKPTDSISLPINRSQKGSASRGLGMVMEAPPPIHEQMRKRDAAAADGALSGPQKRVLKALAWWAGMGHPAPSREQVAAICEWRPGSGHFNNVLAQLKSAGMIVYPASGAIALTDDGRGAAPVPDSSATVISGVRATLSGPQAKVFDALLNTDRAMGRERLAGLCSWEPKSGHFNNILGQLRTLKVIEYPRAGVVALQDWVK